MVKVAVEGQLVCPQCGADPSDAQVDQVIKGMQTVACGRCGKVNQLRQWLRPFTIKRLP